MLLDAFKNELQIKVGWVLKNSGNLPLDCHKKKLNLFRNSWDIWDLEIDILQLHRGQKIILVLQVTTLTSIIFVISKWILKILVPIM